MQRHSSENVSPSISPKKPENNDRGTQNMFLKILNRKVRQHGTICMS